MLQTFATKQWNETLPEAEQTRAVGSLENGQILYFPELAFSLSSEEQHFLCPDYVDPKAKNISYNSANIKLGGVRQLTDLQQMQMKGMLDRFSCFAHGLIKEVLPSYIQHLIVARTSYRPVEISGRASSWRKDDTRLHVDSFPSAPNQGKRILRVFCNINPKGEERVWRVGESFDNVADRFLPRIRKPVPGSAFLLNLSGLTKSYRTLYDHYMLQMHNQMKADGLYQKKAEQQEIRFPAGSSWIVQTDDVSHAAMQGQYVLEQTFYLPVKAMRDENKSPLRVLERILSRKLV